MAVRTFAFAPAPFPPNTSSESYSEPAGLTPKPLTANSERAAGALPLKVSVSYSSFAWVLP